MLHVFQVTNRRLLILDIAIVYAQLYGLIMEQHAQLQEQGLCIKEHMAILAMEVALVRVFGC